MSWDRPANPLERIVHTSLLPASVAYGVGSYFRTVSYSIGALKRTKLPATVISVGNLSCGGTGKTPVTIDLARRLIAAGQKVAVLSRGYKRQSDAPHVVVNDGRQTLASCQDAGDEPYLIAQAVPQAVVIVGADRVATGNLAIAEYGSQIILLDDGFQHVRLKRDRDIVLIDYSEGLEKAALLPAGRLREPLSALGRATSIVISKVPVGCDPEQMAAMTTSIRRHNKQADISFCQFKPVCSQNLRGQRVLAFCGIAKPEQFLNALNQLGATVIKHQTFADHYWYSPEDLEQIDAAAHKLKADFLVTTEKDLVRFSAQHRMQCPIATVVQETSWLGELPRAVADFGPPILANTTPVGAAVNQTGNRIS